MAEISKISAVAIANVAKVDAVTKANIADINGLTIPADGAPAAAYSVRLLGSAVGVSSYTGDCMRIREDSGDTETDIGFDGSGDLDTAAIATHCGSANGYVVTWYDQSGNSNDADQNTFADQPQIYDGTTVTSRNGKPILTFVDASDHLDTATVSLSGPHTAFACAYNQNSFSAQLSLMYHSSGNYLWIYAVNKVQIQNGSEFVSASGSYGNNSAIISCVIDGSNSISRGKNSVEEQTATGTVTSRTITSIRLGAVTSGRETDVQEWILWNEAKDSTDRAAIETNINNYFSIY